MRKTVTILIVFVAVAVFTSAAEAEEFFQPKEKQEICAVVAEVFPGVGVLFSDTCAGDAGLLIGPMPNGEFLFIFVKRGGEIFIYQPPAKYEWAALQICKAINLTMDFWDGQRALGPGPKESRGR